jgi:hypothetical protein
MHISQAKPASKFYRIPMAVHQVIIADPVVGRGHLLTFITLAAYLWSDQTVEGTRAEWSEVTGISAQTFEAHLPALGSAGCLSYSQPHVGYYVLYGLPQDDTQVAALRAAWQQAEAEFEESGLSKRMRGSWVTSRVQALKLTLDQASKLTLPVVDTSTSSVLSVIENADEQASKLTLEASKNTLDGASKLTQPAEASKLTLDAGFAQVVRLYEQEIGGTLTAMMLDEFNELWGLCADLERWRYAFKASIGKRARWAYIKAIIQNPQNDRRDNGRDADSRKPGARARGKAAGADGGERADVAGGVSHDIDAWFGAV